MARVRGRDTGPEVALRKALFAAGVRGWRCHRRDLPGRPDLAFGRTRVAVFVDGAFWHGHPDKYWPGRSGPYWDAKIERNRARDCRVEGELVALGWRVVRLWDFEVAKEPAAAVARVVGTLKGGRGMSVDEEAFREAVRRLVAKGTYPKHTTIRDQLGMESLERRSGLKGDQTRWRAEEVERAGYDWPASKREQRLVRHRLRGDVVTSRE